MIKKIIKRVFRSKGFTIVPINEYQEKLEKVKYNWLVALDFTCIIDVGASNGGFARKARGLFPQTKIFSFEPMPAVYEELNQHFLQDNNFRSYNIACSDVRGSVDFFVSSNQGSSSLLDMGNAHKEAYPGSAEITKIHVNTDTLDNILLTEKTGDMIFLKMDVQGGEMKVLEGAPEILKKVSLIFTEVSFIELYEGQPLVNEMIRYLAERGFLLMGIENVSQQLTDGQYLQADLYFKRRES